jgi:hypothetical protein
MSLCTTVKPAMTQLNAREKEEETKRISGAILMYCNNI